MRNVRESILSIIPDDVRMSIIVERDGERIVSIRPNDRYEMASTANISLAYYTVSMIDRGELDPEEPLTLKKHHKRGGTGILRNFRAGFGLTLLEALQIMLVESDNTAANVLLDFVGGQQVVNEWLREAGFAETGLTDRDDRLYESDVASAENMFSIFRAFMARPLTDVQEKCRAALCRSHYVNGLLYHVRRHERLLVGYSAKWITLQLRARMSAGFLSWQARQSRLLNEAIHGPMGNQWATKEGILPHYEGVDYLHELGARFVGAPRGSLTVGVFSAGNHAEAESALACIGQILDEVK